MQVKNITTNTHGRDFVIGDLHGHYKVLMALLDSHQFDKTKDRLISCGDLVDRGPRSWDCLQLYREPWFHGVRGNHESCLLRLAFIAEQHLLRGSDTQAVASLIREFSASMESEWFADWLTVQANRRKLPDLIALLTSIPDILTVRGDGFSYNVVHAELASGGISTDDGIVYVEYDPLIEDASPMASATKWSRTLFKEWVSKEDGDDRLPYDSNSGLSLTFCGHNVTPKPFIWANHFFIDTGCGFVHPELRDVLGLTAVILPGFEIAFVPSMDAKKPKPRKRRVTAACVEAVA